MSRPEWPRAGWRTACELWNVLQVAICHGTGGHGLHHAEHCPQLHKCDPHLPHLTDCLSGVLTMICSAHMCMNDIRSSLADAKVVSVQRKTLRIQVSALLHPSSASYSLAQERLPFCPSTLTLIYCYGHVLNVLHLATAPLVQSPALMCVDACLLCRVCEPQEGTLTSRPERSHKA